MSYVQRFRGIFAAQIFSQAVTIIVQLSLVPILLRCWGTGLYGVWLLLSAIPFYLTFSDFGFTFVAKNEMLMAVAAGSKERALATFQSILLLLNIAVPMLFLSMAAVADTVDVSALLALHGFPVGSARAILIALVGNVLLYQYSLLINAGIRCENRPAIETIWAATSRLGEGLAIALSALAGKGMLFAALAMVGNRTLFLVASYAWLRRASPWIRFGTRHARMPEIRRLSQPALAYMFLPIGQALLIQAPVLVVGHVLDPVSVVVFATSRTLARTGTAVTNMFNNTLIAEYASLAGRASWQKFRELNRHQSLIGVGLIAAYALSIMVLAVPLMRIFTHGRVPVAEPLFIIVVAGVAAEMVWSSLFTPISAINAHKEVTHWFLALSAIGIAATWPVTRWVGMPGAAACVMAVHLVMIVVTASRVGAVATAGQGALPPATGESAAQRAT